MLLTLEFLSPSKKCPVVQDDEKLGHTDAGALSFVRPCSNQQPHDGADGRRTLTSPSKPSAAKRTFDGHRKQLSPLGTLLLSLFDEKGVPTWPLNEQLVIALQGTMSPCHSTRTNGPHVGEMSRRPSHNRGRGKSSPPAYVQTPESSKSQWLGSRLYHNISSCKRPSMNSKTGG